MSLSIATLIDLPRSATWFCVFLSVFFAGCSGTKAWLAEKYLPTKAEQEASWVPFRGELIQGVPAKSFVLDRTGYVFSDVESKVISPVPTVDGVQQATANVQFQGKYHGNAIALSPDGYLMTTRFAMDEKKIPVLAMRNLSSSPDVFHAGLQPVFRGNVKELDFAIVRANEPLEAVSEWSDQPPAVGDVVFAGNAMDNKPSAGHVIRVKQISTKDGYEHYRIEHDAPVRENDVSGPLFAADGKLVAINSRIHVFFGIKRGVPCWGSRCSIAIRPDPNYVAKLIAEHREKMLAQKPPGSVSPWQCNPPLTQPLPARLLLFFGFYKPTD